MVCLIGILEEKNKQNGVYNVIMVEILLELKNNKFQIK